jgi:tRNA-dihydrouridine synthase B
MNAGEADDPTPPPLRIGRHAISARAALAPMAGVTDRPFRVLCRRFGAGYAPSEMITSDVRLWSSPKSRRRMDHSGEPSPRIVQLAGADPQALAEAARRNVDLGAEIIDLNMGCPAKKVCDAWCGSALMRDEALVARILRAVVAAVAVPVTLKTRTGWDREHRNAPRIARIAEESGIQLIAIHGRTRADLYTGEAEYDTIRDIKSALRIPVIANGDITSAQKARAVLDLSGADGVMIGRAAHGAPWIFRDVNAHLNSPRNSPATLAPLARAEVRDIILAHLESLYAFYGEHTGLRVARKHLGWYCSHLTEPASVRKRLMTADTSSSQFAAARDELDRWAGTRGWAA